MHYRRLWLPRLWSVIGLVVLLLLGTGATQKTSSAHASPASSSCTWNLVSSPNPGTYSNFLAGVAAASAQDVWAVGNSQSNGIVETLTEHWHANTWSVIPSPNPSPEAELNAVARIPGTHKFWAVGEYFSTYLHTLIMQWNGSAWVLVPSPNVGQDFNFLHGVVAISAHDAWAVGSVIAGTTTSPLTEHWNGKSWSIVKSPNTGTFFSILVAVAAVSSTNVWAVGGTNTGTLTERWNGKSWSIVKSPTPGSGGSLTTVTNVPGSKHLWAAGYYFPSISGQSTLIEEWNGKSWLVVSSPSPGTGFNILQSITAISANNVWAVGYDSPFEVPIIALVEHWNGSSWSLVSVPSPDVADDLFGVTRIPHTHKLWAVGTPAHQINDTLTEVCQ